MISLYTKSVYNFMSSTITIDGYIDYGLKHNCKELSLCDDNLYYAYPFIKKCLSNNINPIIGLDLNNILLFSKNYDGYLELLKINTLKEEGNIKLDSISSSNLICVIPFNKIDNSIKKYINNLECYIGLNNIEYRKYKEMNINIKPIYAKKVLCLNENDVDTLKYLNMMRDDFTIKDKYEFNSDVMNDNELSFNSDFSMFEEFKLPKYDWLLPDYCSINGINSSNFDYLTNLSIKGLNKRIINKDNKEIYLERLNHELNVIKEMDFASYFLIVYDYVLFAKKNKILVGPGRGSACSSLVAYSIGITDIDPIEYNLLFERFLNKDRISMPDIDIDFSGRDREKVVDYIRNKYGNKCVTNIVTFSSIGLLGIRELGKVLNKNDVFIDNIGREVKKYKCSIKELINDKVFISDKTKEERDFLNICAFIEDFPKNSSIHACGVVIGNQELDNIIPISLDNNKYISCVEKDYLEELGLLKMDILSLDTLTKIDKMIELINKNGVNISYNNIPYNDSDTYKLFSNGNTFGIFQFEGENCINFLKEYKPRNLFELACASAFIRPGPNENINELINLRNSNSINVIDSRLNDLLSETNGFILFQEQVMLITIRMAKFSYTEADTFRKGIGKKNINLINELKDKFINGSINNGYSKELSTKVFDLLVKFSNYGFNKAHSIAYADISYKMGFIKTHYPLEYYLSCIEDNDISFINDAKRNGVNIINPDVNLSKNNCYIKDNGIVLSINFIKKVNKKLLDSIINNQPYKDIYEFFSKNYSSFDKRSIKSIYSSNISTIQNNEILRIIDSGLLDSLGYNRRTLSGFDNHWFNLDKLLDYGDMPNTKININKVDEYSKEELNLKEKEIFGFYLNHPVSLYRDNNNYVNTIDTFINRNIEVLLMVDRVKKIKDKNNRDMEFLTCSDETGIVDVTIFSSEYNSCIEIKENDIIRIEGRVSKKNSKYGIILNKLIDIINR